jgi:hypothetical protein
MGELLNRWAIFAIALILRAAIAFLFFGSVDVTNSMKDAQRMLGGVPPSWLPLPYLPGMQSVFRMAAVIGFHAEIPLTFLYKLPSCLFDSAIAAMIGDARDARTGLLYAIAPVPLLIFGIHGQWDSISLAFLLGGMLLLLRPRASAAAGAGVLAVLSVIAKPIAAPFLLFFLERRRIAYLAAGAAACFAAYLVVLWGIGDPLSMRTISSIVRYAGEGTSYLGLPYALGITPNRLLMLAATAILLPLYRSGRVSREQAVLLSYAWIIGALPLGAQYLSWLLPFLLLLGHLRFAAIYGLLAGIYLATFYASAGHTATHALNLGAFAPLRFAAWLTPGGTASDAKVKVLLAVGDFLLPVACLCWLALRGWRAAKPSEAPRTGSLAPLAIAFAAVAILIVVALALPAPSAAELEVRTNEKVRAYDLVRHPDGERWVIPEAAGVPHRGGMTANHLAYAWIGAWSLAAYLTAARERRYIAA